MDLLGLYGMDMPQRMSPIERLITGLVDALPENQSGLYGSGRPGERQQCDGSCRYWVPGYSGSRPVDRKQWIHVINIGNFDPKEVSAKIEAGQVVVHAKHEQKKGDNYDLYERRRTVKVPEGVDPDKVSCFVGGDGRCFIKGPFIEKEENSALESGDKSADGASSQTSVADQDEKQEEGENTSLTTSMDSFLSPLMDSAKVVEDGLNKNYEVKLNLKNFKPEDVSIRFVDNELQVDAQKEVNNDGVYAIQEVHRKFRIPEEGVLNDARAEVSSTGVVTVTVPLRSQTSEEARTIPILHMSE